MIIHHNYLRVYRKKSRLTQGDLAYVLDLGDYSNVSRWEHGQRQPNIETLLTYHLLFNLPIEMLFERQKNEMVGRVAQRTLELAQSLESDPDAEKARAEFLKGAHARLSALYANGHV